LHATRDYRAIDLNCVCEVLNMFFKYWNCLKITKNGDVGFHRLM